MVAVNSILTSMISMFLVMFAGFFLRIRGYIDERVTKGLSTILVLVGLPAMIIHGLQQPFSAQKLGVLGVMTGGFSAVIILGALACFLVCRLRGTPLRESGVWMNCAAFSNAIFMARPIATTLFGEDVIFPLTGIMFSFNLLTFTLGVTLVNLGGERGVGRSIRGALLSPAMAATVIGFSLFLFSVELPQAVRQSLSMVTGTTTPLTMLIIGSLLAQSHIRSIFADPRVYIISTIRLIAVPALSWLILRNFVQDQLLLSLLILSAAMPCGTTTAVFSERYGNNPELASRAVFLSTILSIATVPVVISFFL